MSDVSNIAILPVGDRMHPDAIIEAARNAKLDRVIILGWDDDGEFFISSSESMESVIYMLRTAEHEMFRIIDRSRGAA